MVKLVRFSLACLLLIAIPAVSDGRCTESKDLMCGMECNEDGYCAMVVTPSGQTSDTMACWEMSGGCMHHDDDCHCGGGGSF